MIIAGIDPGKSGALSILFDDDSVLCWDVPLAKVKGKSQPAWSQWHSNWSGALSMIEPDMFVIEQVASRPGQGVSSMFKFGQTYGFTQAIAISAGKPIHFVTPSAWKGKLGLLNSDKAASREKVRQLFPQAAHLIERVKDDGRAEALLLAYYGRRFL